MKELYKYCLAAPNSISAHIESLNLNHRKLILSKPISIVFIGSHYFESAPQSINMTARAILLLKKLDSFTDDEFYK
jgi:hypothetical protein